MTQLEFVPESRYENAPKLPVGRPSTKTEVFAYWSHVLDGVKTPDEIKQHARGSWAWDYVWHRNFRSWDKHPDWQPGDPVINEAVPAKPFTAGANYIEAVEQLWQLARQIKRERFGT